MPKTDRLAALLADPEVVAALNDIERELNRAIPAAQVRRLVTALDRSAPKTPEGHRWNVEKTERGIRLCRGDHPRAEECDWEYYTRAERIPETPEAVREYALIATGRFLSPTLQREAANIADAIAPILRAADQREIARLTKAQTDNEFDYLSIRGKLDTAEAEVARLKARLADVEGAVGDGDALRGRLTGHSWSSRAVMKEVLAAMEAPRE